MTAADAFETPNVTDIDKKPDLIKTLEHAC